MPDDHSSGNRNVDRVDADARLLSEFQATIDDQLVSAKRTELLWSWGRMVTFLSASLAWYFVGGWSAATAVVTGVLVAAFAVSVMRHTAAKGRRTFLDRLVEVAGETTQRHGGNVVVIRSLSRPTDSALEGAALSPVFDDGRTWRLSAQECADLDLYGDPIGLFGLLNRTSTALGARRLRDMCENLCLSRLNLSARSGCVRWLDENPTIRLRLMAATAVARNKDQWLDALVSAVRLSTPLANPGRVRLLRHWSAISGVFMLVASVYAMRGVPGWLGGLLLVALFNTTLYAQMRRTLSASLRPWRDLSTMVGGIRSICQRSAELLPADSPLALLRERFAQAADRRVLSRLRWRLEWTNTGGAVHATLNALVLYDLHVADAILTCVDRHRDTIVEALAAIAELDALTSLACFAWEQPVWCYPEISDDTTLLITGGVHPLVSPEKVVANDVRLVSPLRVVIVTGSNMAGKSTYLRMIGVNVFLAQLGTTAAADAMRWSPVRLMSDLRVSDSLAKEESYFIAEVRQVRRMLQTSDGEAPVLGLVDEPFRGTNSKERIAASLAVVSHFVSSGGLFVVATHEHRLTDLADGRSAVNVHFDEDLDAAGPVFDHRLRPGPAERRNALRILAREGFPEELVQRAHRWADDADEQSAGE